MSLRFADAPEEASWGLDEHAWALQVGQVSIAGNENVSVNRSREMTGCHGAVRSRRAVDEADGFVRRAANAVAVKCSTLALR